MIDLAAFLIGFREALEASLIIGIVLAYLIKTNQREFSKFVWFGVVAAIVSSLLVAFLFTFFVGKFEGKAEELFEGSLMLFAAVLVSWMILWALKQKHTFRKNLEANVETNVLGENVFGIFFLAFVAVLREGVETVIFLNASFFESGGSSVIFGALLGIIVAIIAGFFLFSGLKKINLNSMFSITSVLLILFAAGLVAHGVHEFQEAGVLPFSQPIWDINPPVNFDGSYPLLHEKGLIGETAKHLFGYNGNPSLLEVLSYIGYLAIIYFLYKKISNKSK